jgi:GTPase SAR1 family protein
MYNKEKVLFPCLKVNCGSRTHEWSCSSCLAPVEFAKIDQSTREEFFFFCQCGMFAMESGNQSFRCCEANHKVFEPFEPRSLKNKLDGLNDKVITLILIGETSAGKTTFVNSLANYMKQSKDSFERLLKHPQEIQSLAYASFSYSDGDSKLSAEFGTKNEFEKAGTMESKTRICKTYLFYWYEYIIKIIDTPGIHDSRGHIQETINSDTIMAYASNYKRIHAFIFCVPAGQAVITGHFKLCFERFLEKLNQQAQQNVIFVYTKSLDQKSSTGFSPKDTDIAIKEIYTEKEIPFPSDKSRHYTVENDGLSWLYCVTVKIPGQPSLRITDKAKRISKDSWNHSSRECRRMMEFIIHNLTPIDGADTHAVYQFRKNTVHLCVFLTILLKSIEINKEKCKAYERHFLSRDLAGRQPELEQIIVRTKLQAPRIVCATTHCCGEHLTNGGTDFPVCYNSQDEFISEYHDINTLYDNESEAVCKVCQHPLKKHLKRTVRFDQQVEQFIPKIPSPQTSLDEHTSRLTAASNLNESIKSSGDRLILKADLDQRMNELEQESVKIMEASAHAWVFIKENSVLNRNDDMIETILEMQLTEIQKERRKSTDSEWFIKKDTVCSAEEHITNVLTSYRSLKMKIMEKRDLKEEDVDNKISDLFNLHIYGDQISECLEKQHEFVHKIEQTFIPERKKAKPFLFNFLSLFATGATRGGMNNPMSNNNTPAKGWMTGWVG